MQIADFGTNSAGILKVSMSGIRGTTVTARFAETLDFHGPFPYIWTENLRAALATDRMILSGNEDKFRSRFTYHGFRFVEFRTLPQNSVVERCLLSSVHSDPASFKTSSPIINGVYALVSNSIVSNYIRQLGF